MLQESSIERNAFLDNNQSANKVALSGHIHQLTQFETAKGTIMSLGSIEGVGNRGKVIIEFSAFGDEDALKQAKADDLEILLEGDLKMFKGKQQNAQWKIQIDVSRVTLPHY